MYYAYARVSTSMQEKDRQEETINEFMPLYIKKFGDANEQ